MTASRQAHLRQRYCLHNKDKKNLTSQGEPNHRDIRFYSGGIKILIPPISLLLPPLGEDAA